MGNKLVSDILRPINTSGIIILGVYTTVWGFWVGNPFWNAFATAEAYEVMDYLPEWVWGLAALGVGAAMLYGVFMNSYESLTRGARAGFYFWIIVCIAFFIGDWQNTGGITYLTIAIYCGFVWLNIRVNKENFNFNTK